MSPIHSTSFLDLNGDCSPDIFIQMTSPTGSGYTHHYDILFSRQVNGEQKFCRHKTNTMKHFVASTAFDKPAAEGDIPYVNFVDIDRDGMMDAYFYYKGQIWVYYNKLPR
jgi:hypothetical protein